MYFSSLIVSVCMQGVVHKVAYVMLEGEGVRGEGVNVSVAIIGKNYLTFL